MRPLDEYPPGVRAPGEGYNGPIADPAEAMRAALGTKDVLAQAAERMQVLVLTCRAEAFSRLGGNRVTLAGG